MNHNGYVAFLDVLGFHELLMAENHERRLRDYLSSMRGVVRTLDAVVFSDTIVITARDKELLSLLSLVRGCADLMRRFLQDKIAVRGAISCGEFVRENIGDKGVFVAGRAILDAYSYEQKQDWVGVMLTPTLLDALRTGGNDPDAMCKLVPLSDDDIFDPGNAKFDWIGCLQRADIPFKGGGTFSGFAVVPGSDRAYPDQAPAEPSERAQWLRDALSRLHTLRDAAPDPRAQAKYDASRKFLEDSFKYWSHVAHRKGHLQKQAAFKNPGAGPQ
jgi:hypothetical protein